MSSEKEQKSENNEVVYQDFGNAKILVQVREVLKTIYDPEFPLVDMETLGLFYQVGVFEEQKKMVITMTFTTPACPMGDMIIEMVKNTLSNQFFDRMIDVEITFDPIRSPQMIKDPDLQRMFQ